MPLYKRTMSTLSSTFSTVLRETSSYRYRYVGLNNHFKSCLFVVYVVWYAYIKTFSYTYGWVHITDIYKWTGVLGIYNQLYKNGQTVSTSANSKPSEEPKYFTITVLWFFSQSLKYILNFKYCFLAGFC